MLVLFWASYILPFFAICLFTCSNNIYGYPRRTVNYLNILFKTTHMYIDHFEKGMDSAQPHLMYVFLSYCFMIPCIFFNVMMTGQQLHKIAAAVLLTKYFGATWTIYHLLTVSLRWGKPEGRRAGVIISMLGLLLIILVILSGIYLNWRNKDLNVPDWIEVNFDRVVDSTKLENQVTC